MRDFLFTTWEGGGNIPPTLTTVRKLVASGHRVRVMSDACNQAEVETAGGEFIPWCRAPSRPDKTASSDLMRDWEASSPQEGFDRMLDKIMCGPALAYARDVIDEIGNQRPDLVVSSEMLFGVMVGCEALRQPLALLSTNLSLFPIPGLPPFGAGLMPARTEADRELHRAVAAAGRDMFNRGLPPLNHARWTLGLEPVTDVYDQTRAAECLLLATSRTFDFPADFLPGHIRYVGPQLDDPAWAEPWTSPWSQDDPRPLVLVAFSTTFQDHAPVVRRVTEALRRMPVRGLVTLGPNLSVADVPPPAENVVVCRSAPHGTVMQRASVVVTHGGHGTVMRALSHRLPLLCMPMGRDQNDNAARVVAHGAGICLQTSASTDEVQAALKQLISDISFARAARRLGDAVAAEAASSPVVQELVRLADANCQRSRLTFTAA